MIRSMLTGLCLCAAVATAQEPRPEVAPFPLEIIRTSDDCSKKDAEDLKKLLPMMLRAAAAAVPDSAKLAAALDELHRQDCNRDDACLAQLAKLAGSLYAFHARLDFDLDGDVVASGRVVRDDGRPVRAPRTVKLPQGTVSFRDAAQTALKQLLVELDLAQLPSFRPQEPLLETPPLVLVTPEAPRVLVPVAPPEKANPSRAIGFIGVGTGAACVLAGALLFATAGVARTEVSQGVVRVVNEDASKVPGIQRAQGAGVALLAVGGGLAVVGAGLALFGPHQPVATVVPLNAGAAVLIAGAIP